MEMRRRRRSSRSKRELDKVRGETRSGETLEVKANALDTAKIEARGAIERAEAALDRQEVRQLGTDAELKRWLIYCAGREGRSRAAMETAY